MNKLVSRIAVIVAAAVFSTTAAGCVPTNNTTEIKMNPDFSKPEKGTLDFAELHNSTIENFEEEEVNPYVYVTDLSIDGSNDDMQINVTATVLDSAEEEDYDNFVSAVLRHMNDAACDQYPDYGYSTSEDFGGLYADYTIIIDILNQEGNKVCEMTIPAGDEIDFDPDIESYEEAFEEMMSEKDE